MSAEREAVRAAAERSWVDVVENYQAGRQAWIAARLADHDRAVAIRKHLDPATCTTDCPAGPHGHPYPFDDELAGIAGALGVGK